MKEFIEKLIGRLTGREKYYHECALDELMKNGHTLDAEGFLGKEDAYSDVLSIVNQLAEEYKQQLPNDLMIVSSLPSLYSLQDFEEEAIQRVVANANDNGWIPCSERLPEEPKEELDEQHDIERTILLGHVTEYIVTIEDATEPTALYYVGDGFWYDEKAEDFCRVAAWRPFMPAWQQNQESAEKAKEVDKKTRGDKIRSMSDEEIAEAIMSLGVDKFEQISFCKNSDRCNQILDAGELIPESLCRQCLMEWLQSKVEE